MSFCAMNFLQSNSYWPFGLIPRIFQQRKYARTCEFSLNKYEISKRQMPKNACEMHLHDYPSSGYYRSTKNSEIPFIQTPSVKWFMKCINHSNCFEINYQWPGSVAHSGYSNGFYTVFFFCLNETIEQYPTICCQWYGNIMMKCIYDISQSVALNEW